MRVESVLHRAMMNADMRVEDIDVVERVGGASRTPAIVDAIKRVFRLDKEPKRSAHAAARRMFHTHIWSLWSICTCVLSGYSTAFTGNATLMGHQNVARLSVRGHVLACGRAAVALCADPVVPGTLR